VSFWVLPICFIGATGEKEKTVTSTADDNSSGFFVRKIIYQMLDTNDRK